MPRERASPASRRQWNPLLLKDRSRILPTGRLRDSGGACLWMSSAWKWISGPIRRGYGARRCLQYGAMINETILRNRYASRQTLQTSGSAAGIG